MGEGEADSGDDWVEWEEWDDEERQEVVDTFEEMGIGFKQKLGRDGFEDEPLEDWMDEISKTTDCFPVAPWQSLSTF